MGFRTGSYCKIWSVKPISNTLTSARISISRKNRQTDQYEQDFGGYVSFVGTACAAKALRLREGDRVKLGDVDVTNRYDKEKNTTYTNFNVFSFEVDGEEAQRPAEVESNLTEGFTEVVDDGDLPF